MQARCGALIVCKFVRELLAGQLKKPAFLMVIVESDGYVRMKSYLEHEGYRVSFGSHKITKFTKSNFRAARDIGVLKADRSVIAQTLDSAFTTAGLTFITWDKVYSLFPVPTFVEKTSCCRVPPPEDLNKYLRSESAADHRLLAWIGIVPLVIIGSEIDGWATGTRGQMSSTPPE